MGKIIAIANQKGGVGKTTTSVNLASALSYIKKKILLIDLDPQGNASQGLGHMIGEDDEIIYDVLLNGCDVREAIVHLNTPRLDLIPSNINLAGADLEMANLANRESILKNQLAQIKDDYDYIFIDCPPSLGLLTTNALTASDSIVIPVQCEYYALEGLTQLLGTIRLVQRVFNPHLKIEGVLLTMADFRTNLSQEVASDVKKSFKETVYDAIIPRNVRLSEAPSQGKTIFEYASKCEGAYAYIKLAQEFLRRNNGGK